MGWLLPPQGLAPLCKGSWQGRQALTEGLWVSYRNGHPVPGHLLLHPTYNPSGSHSFATSPYTGEARGGGRLLAPFSFVPRPKRRGFTGGTWFRPSDRARPALRCRPAFPQKRPRSRGGFRGAFRFPRKTSFAGSPGNFIDFRQMNCRKSDAGTRRRGYKGPPAAFLSTFRRWKVDECPTAQARRGPRSI